jgi:hypothetical protein
MRIVSETCYEELREQSTEKKKVERIRQISKISVEKKVSFSSKKEGRKDGRKEGRKCLSGLCFGEHMLRGGKTIIYKLRCFV